MITIRTRRALPEWVKIPINGENVICRAYPLSRLGDDPPYEYALERMDDPRCYEWEPAQDAA